MRAKDISFAGSSAIGLSIVVVFGPAAAGARAEPRPYIFGCGITWGSWLGLSSADAKEFDRRSMDKIVQMGGTACGANFAWIDIETVRGVFNWDYVDHQVNEARARGLEIFAYSGLTPDWALPPGILERYGSGIGYRFPPDPQYIPDFENFFRTLAARYRGRVKYYEFWNEPNGCSWINDGCSNGHMAHTYVPWLIRWYTAMKQGDPDCVLAVGGLDYGDYVTEGWRYIEDIYANGGGDYFDAVAIHPYGNPLHWQAITDTYQVLVNHGHGHKKLWLNEYGWNTTDEAQKSANLTTVLNELKKPAYHMVFEANYLVLTDLPGTPPTGHDYGLCSRNLNTLTITPRQSWYAFQAVDKSFPDVVDFVANPVAGPLPLAVQFTDLSSVDGAAAWLWQFGDGAVSTERNPMHVYTRDGEFTVQLTVTGTHGPVSAEKAAYIRAGQIPPVPGVANPSFEDNGGSYAGWQIVHVTGEGPDNPPLANGNPYGPTTPFGTHFGGKVTSGLRMDFYLGQVVGTSSWHSLSPAANWRLNTYVQINCTHENQPRPTGVHQVWEIGWNDDGSEPAGIMSCDHYQVVASVDGTYTGNDAVNFYPLSAGGTIEGIRGLRGVAVRVHMFNDAAWWWTRCNTDNLGFVVTALPPPQFATDLDADGDVDLADFAYFQTCFNGPNRPAGVHCTVDADFDRDADVDLADFGILQGCFNGPNRPPACG